MTSIETPTYDTVEVTVGFAGGLVKATQKSSHTFQEACYSKKSTWDKFISKQSFQ